MKYCHQCHKLTLGEPVFCNFCGSSFGLKLCGRLHSNPRSAWWESDQPQVVWKSNFKFAGICTHCYKDGVVERIVKASAARLFLEEIFGPA